MNFSSRFFRNSHFGINLRKIFSHILEIILMERDPQGPRHNQLEYHEQERFERGLVVFFGGMRMGVNRSSIYEYFAEGFGELRRLELDQMRSSYYKRVSTILHRGSGKVEFMRADDARQAASEEQHIIEGTIFYVRMALPRSQLHLSLENIKS